MGEHGAKPHTPFIINRFVREQSLCAVGTACASMCFLTK